jgi:hypothetical protein
LITALETNNPALSRERRKTFGSVPHSGNLSPCWRCTPTRRGVRTAPSLAGIAALACAALVTSSATCRSRSSQRNLMPPSDPRLRAAAIARSPFWNAAPARPLRRSFGRPAMNQTFDDILLLGDWLGPRMARRRAMGRSHLASGNGGGEPRGTIGAPVSDGNTTKEAKSHALQD